MIPLFKVHMTEDAIEASSEVLRSGFITQGKKVDEFEEALRQVWNNPNVVTVNSATSGLTLALRILGEHVNFDKATDVVLTIPLTCTATNWSILANGMNLQWVDVDPTTCNMSLEDLEAKITRQTKLIVFVHWGGTPLDLDRLSEILDRKEQELGFRPRVVEDCAHAFMSRFGGEMIGGTRHGNTCVFSFQAIKHLTSVDGGAITFANNEEGNLLTKKARLLRWYGIDRDVKTISTDMRMENDVASWGHKYHMNDVIATIGLANLKSVSDSVVEKHRANGLRYLKEITSTYPLRVRHLSANYNAESSYWIFTLLVDDATRFIAAMKEQGIMASQVHKRNDLHSCVKSFVAPLPNLESIANSYVCIPVGWWLTDTELEHITTQVNQYAASSV